MDTVTLTKAEYQNLLDSHEIAVAMRDVAAGKMPVLSHADALKYLNAKSPLAFWRKHRGFTQTALAQKLGISQAYLGQIEAGSRVGDVHLFARIAKALQVRIEDLIEETGADAA